MVIFQPYAVGDEIAGEMKRQRTNASDMGMIGIRRRRLLLLGAAFALGAKLFTPAWALTQAEKAQVDEVSRFFNSFRTLAADFTQISPRGRVSTGKMFIARPGRLRFEYTPPHPLLIVSDGTWIAIRNKAKDRVDYFPLSKTPLKMVLAEKVDLWRDAEIVSVQHAQGLLMITLRGRDKSMPGSLLLVYDPERRTLQQWTVIDGEGRRTTVTLGQLQMNVALDPKLFHVQRPREGAQRRVRQNFGSSRH